MNAKTIIRAWKDPAFRASLTAEERAQIPAHPAGMVELSDAQLNGASGGEGHLPATYLCSFTCTWGAQCPTCYCTLTIR